MNRFDDVVSFEEYHSGVVNLSREMYDDIDLKWLQQSCKQDQHDSFLVSCGLREIPL